MNTARPTWEYEVTIRFQRGDLPRLQALTDAEDRPLLPQDVELDQGWLSIDARGVVLNVWYYKRKADGKRSTRRTLSQTPISDSDWLRELTPGRPSVRDALTVLWPSR